MFRIHKNLILVILLFGINLFVVKSQSDTNSKLFTVNFKHTQIDDKEYKEKEHTQLGFAINVGGDLLVYTPISFLLDLMKDDFYIIKNWVLQPSECTKIRNDKVIEGCFSENLSQLKITIRKNGDTKEEANGILVGYDLNNSLLAIYPDKENFITETFSLPKGNNKKHSSLYSQDLRKEFNYKVKNINSISITDDTKIQLSPFMNSSTHLFISNVKKNRAYGINMKSIIDGAPFSLTNSKETVRAYALSFSNDNKITGVLLSDTIILKDIAGNFDHTEQELNKYFSYLKNKYRFIKACNVYFNSNGTDDKSLKYLYIHIAKDKNRGIYFESYIKLEYYIRNQDYEKLNNEVEKINTSISHLRESLLSIDYDNVIDYLVDINRKVYVHDHFKDNYPKDYRRNKSYGFIKDLIETLEECETGFEYFENIVSEADSLYKKSKCHEALEVLDNIGESRIYNNQNKRINLLKREIKYCINNKRDNIQCQIFSLIDSNSFVIAKANINKYLLQYEGKYSDYMYIYLIYKEACFIFADSIRTLSAERKFQKITDRKNEIKYMIKNDEPICDGISLVGIVEDSQKKLDSILNIKKVNKLLEKTDSIIIVDEPISFEQFEEDFSNNLFHATKAAKTKGNVFHKITSTVVQTKDGNKIIFDVKVDSTKLKINRSNFELGLYKDASIEAIATLLIRTISRSMKDYSDAFEIDSLTFYGSADGFSYGGNNFNHYKRSYFSNLKKLTSIPVIMIENKKVKNDTSETYIEILHDDFKKSVSTKNKYSKKPKHLIYIESNRSMSDIKNKSLACFRGLYFASLIKENETLNSLPVSYKAEFYSKDKGYKYRRVTMEMYFKRK